MIPDITVTNGGTLRRALDIQRIEDERRISAAARAAYDENNRLRNLIGQTWDQASTQTQDHWRHLATTVITSYEASA